MVMMKQEVRNNQLLLIHYQFSDSFIVKFGSNVRCELGSVMYAANVLGSRGPRKMQVAVPGNTASLI